jgi:uncharacterized protein YwqG
VSYTSRIEGTLALHPFPDDDAIPALRAALAALGGPGGGRLVLTPLGRGLGFEDTVDWTAALESIERAILTVLSPRNLAFMGVLRAIGEDEALLATITVNGGAVNVEHHEATEIEASEEKEAEWAAFLEYADELDLSHHADGLLGLCVASLRLEPRKKSTLKSRIGGLPDAPAGFPWPTSDGGEPLSFVAQLDLAEVRASGLPSATLLPERGLLSFFHGYAPGADADHPGNAGRVLFFDSKSPLVPARAPEHPSTTLVPRTPIAFALQTEEVPPIESPFYALLLAGQGPLEVNTSSRVIEAFGTFVANYGPPGVRDEDERPVHRLLGYADPLQSDVYLCTEANATGLPLASWGSLEHHRAAARWQLLLQIDSDPAREMLFGDNGVLAFMIREDDLAARRFDRVWVDWQSH